MASRSNSSVLSFFRSANSVHRSRQVAGSLRKTLSSLVETPKIRNNATVEMYASDCLGSGVEIEIIAKFCDFGEDVYSISGGGDDVGESCAFDHVIRRE